MPRRVSNDDNNYHNDNSYNNTAVSAKVDSNCKSIRSSSIDSSDANYSLHTDSYSVRIKPPRQLFTAPETSAAVLE